MTAGVFGVAIRRTPVVLTQMMIAMHKLILLSTFLTVPGIAQEHAQSPSTEVRILPTGAAKWIQQLGSDDYRDRLNAENKLREMGTRAVQELKAAAGDGGDGEARCCGRGRSTSVVASRRRAPSVARMSSRLARGAICKQVVGALPQRLGSPPGAVRHRIAQWVEPTLAAARREADARLWLASKPGR